MDVDTNVIEERNVGQDADIMVTDTVEDNTGDDEMYDNQQIITTKTANDTKDNHDPIEMNNSINIRPEGMLMNGECDEDEHETVTDKAISNGNEQNVGEV